MDQNEDDVKIFHPSARSTEGTEFIEIAAMTDRQRANGNTAKAKMIGEELADLTCAFLSEQGFDISFLDTRDEFRARVLMLFSFQIALHQYMPNSLISSEAVNSMFNRLQDTSENFFRNIADASSFSFYFLCVRGKRNVEESIGKRFAKLCDKENDERYISLGMNIFSGMKDYVCSLIEESEFVE